MALAKKGSRSITVNEIVYRWTVSPDDEPGLGIVVENKNSPGQRLVTWVEHGTTISPGLVKKIILNALDQGWNSLQKGPPCGYPFNDSRNRKLSQPSGSPMMFFDDTEINKIWEKLRNERIASIAAEQEIDKTKINRRIDFKAETGFKMNKFPRLEWIEIEKAFKVVYAKKRNTIEVGIWKKINGNGYQIWLSEFHELQELLLRVETVSTLNEAGLAKWNDLITCIRTFLNKHSIPFAEDIISNEK